MKDEALYVVIPAYNEEENIENVINDWYPVVERYGSLESRLVIVDDGSKDATYTIAQKWRETKPLLEVFSKENEGHGATLMWGYRYALDQKADYIFQTDSDGQTTPEEFSEFWENRKQYHIIIGDRSSRKDGWKRVFVARVLRTVIRIMFGVKAQDVNTPYRLMQAETLRGLLGYIPDKCPLTNVVMTAVYLKKEKRVKFIPISFSARQKGTNSINLTKIIKLGMASLREFHQINKSIK